MIASVTLGQSDLCTAPLGYGCMRLAGDGTAEAIARGKRAVLTACEAGFTLFDHADIYGGGRCESIFGEVLHENPGLRERLLVTTKCGIRMRATPQAADPQRYDFSRAHILGSCEASLRRLMIDRIDLLRLHRPDFLCNPSEVAEAFQQLQTQGKVRYFGVSNFTPAQVRALQSACPMPLVVHQIEVNLGNIKALTDGTLDQCVELRITPEAWCPLAGIGHPSHESGFDDAARGRVGDELKLQAEAYATSPEAIALAWLLKHPAGMIPLIGSTLPEHIQACVQATRLPYSRESWYRLLEARRGHRVA